jgi:hypothetical protein
MAITGRTKLLIQEPPLLVLPTLARHFGVNEAMVLQQVHFLAQRANAYHRAGYGWVFNSYTGWLPHFPFLSLATLKRTFRRLERLGVLVSARFKKEAWNQLKFYRLDYERLAELIDQDSRIFRADVRGDQSDPIEGDQNDPIDGINLTPSIGSGCADVEETKTPTKTSTKTHTPVSPPETLPSREACVSGSETIDAPEDEDVQEFIDGWNEICGDHGLPAVTRPTSALRKKIAARLRQIPDHDFWETVFNKCVDTRFLRGEGPRGWQVTLSWLVANEENAIRVYEGNYDGLPAKST